MSSCAASGSPPDAATRARGGACARRIASHTAGRGAHAGGRRALPIGWARPEAASRGCAGRGSTRAAPRFPARRSRHRRASPTRRRHPRPRPRRPTRTRRPPPPRSPPPRRPLRPPRRPRRRAKRPKERCQHTMSHVARVCARAPARHARLQQLGHLLAPGAARLLAHRRVPALAVEEGDEVQLGGHVANELLDGLKNAAWKRCYGALTRPAGGARRIVVVLPEGGHRMRHQPLADALDDPRDKQAVEAALDEQVEARAQSRVLVAPHQEGRRRRAATPCPLAPARWLVSPRSTRPSPRPIRASRRPGARADALGRAPGLEVEKVATGGRRASAKAWARERTRRPPLVRMQPCTTISFSSPGPSTRTIPASARAPRPSTTQRPAGTETAAQRHLHGPTMNVPSRRSSPEQSRVRPLRR